MHTKAKGLNKIQSSKEVPWRVCISVKSMKLKCTLIV